MSASLSLHLARPGRIERALPVAVAAFHGLALAWLVTAAASGPLDELARPLAVRLIEEERPSVSAPVPARKVAPRPAAPLPTPVAVSPVPAPVAEAMPAPVAAVVPPLASSSAPPPPAAVEVPVSAARFDADYLQNPRPVYPAASRRLGEEGRAVLRVLVGADGHPEKIELKNSSGFGRLDHAAQEAVGKWRFVPARRGEQAVSAWVLVPIVFSLES